jgi:hypothetical protein
LNDNNLNIFNGKIKTSAATPKKWGQAEVKMC